MSIADAGAAPRGAAEAFARRMGRAPAGIWRSPGRVNLVGEHTDYNDGFVLPATIDRSATVAAALRPDGLVRCASLQYPDVVEARLEDVGPGVDLGWSAHLIGPLWALRRAGVAIPGAELVVDSSIPIGAGLASSAALAVAACLAVSELAGGHLLATDIACCCQAGEEAIVGAPTGMMDQVAVLAGGTGSAVLLDCRSLEHTLVPFAPERSGATLLVIDTAVAHDNSLGGYRERREQCAAAAAALGVPSLRDATIGGVSARLTGTLQRRARHVVTENGRVLRVAELLRAGRVPEIGPLLNESHASLRDDFDVSCAELDCAVDAARRAGAWGARMTGAGFGGSAIALVPTAARDSLVDAVLHASAAHGHAAPRVFDVTTAAGAQRCG
jgi:galactokinase